MSIVITGASSGIGLAVARSLAINGAEVIAVARTQRSLELLQQQFANRIHVIAADLSTDSGRGELLDHVNSIGSLNGIVHAAGSHISPTPYQALNEQSLLQDMRIHVTTPMVINNQLKEKLHGARVLFIDSYSASTPRTGWAGYSIVKSAAQMAARSAADELTQSRVIRVFPGAVQTPLVDVVLRSEQSSPTVDLFKQLKSTGQLSDPKSVGDFIADILLVATDAELDQREYWDINRSEDQIFS